MHPQLSTEDQGSVLGGVVGTALRSLSSSLGVSRGRSRSSPRRVSMGRGAELSAVMAFLGHSLAERCGVSCRGQMRPSQLGLLWAAACFFQVRRWTQASAEKNAQHLRKVVSSELLALSVSSSSPGIGPRL